MRKNQAIILLLVVLLVTIMQQAQPVYASYSQNNEYQPIMIAATVTEERASLDPDSASENTDDDQFWGENDKGNIFERIVAGLVYIPVKITKFVSNAAGFKDINTLVFLQGVTDEERSTLPWSATQKDALDKWYYALMVVTTPLYIIVITVTAFKFFYAATNPMARKELQESIERWFLSIGIMILAPFLIQLMMEITGAIMDGIVIAFNSIVGPMSDSGLTSKALLDINISTGSILGTALVKAMFALICFYFNILYIVRTIAMSVMFAFTPLMAILWAMQKNTPAIAVWLGELASNAVMPIAHGLVLCTIMLLVDVKNISQGGTWVTILIMLYTLIPLSEALRNSMMSIWTRAAGVNEAGIASGLLGGTGMLATSMGLGGMVSVGRVAGATFGNRNAGIADITRDFSNLNKSGLKGRTIANPKRSAYSSGFIAGGIGEIGGPASSALLSTHNSNLNNRGFMRMSTGANMDYRFNKFNKRTMGGRPLTNANATPKRAVNPQKYHAANIPKSSVLNSQGLGKAFRAASVAASVMTAPMGMVAGAIPGGQTLYRGVTAGTAAGLRSLATAGMMARDIYSQKRAGNMGWSQALQKVTGETSHDKALGKAGAMVIGSAVAPAGVMRSTLRAESLARNQEHARLQEKHANAQAKLRKIVVPPNKAQNALAHVNRQFTYIPKVASEEKKVLLEANYQKIKNGKKFTTRRRV